MFRNKAFRRATTLLVSAGLAVVAIVAAIAAAGPTWTSLAPMPVATEGGQTGVIGNTIVVAYGFSSGDTNLTRLYDIDANSWSPGATAPGPNRSEGTAVTHGGNLYAIGGRPQGAVGSRIDRYNLASDTWTSTLAPMPTARAGLGAAVVGNAIYAIGGRTGFAGAPCGGSPTAAVERYDIDTDSWTAVAPLPAALSDLAAVTHGGNIYVFGGCTSPSSFSSAVYVYDTTTNSWSTATPMPRARAAFYQVGKKGNEIYVMGGLNPALLPFSPARPEVDIYNVTKDSWTTSLTPMPNPRGEMGVVSHGGRIYTVGGAKPAFGSSQATNDVLKP